jgi:SAM-dependent methyltransferase
MYLDVADLQEFYATRLGLATGLLLQRKVRGIWPEVKGLRVLGLGFCSPFLGSFLDEAERVVSLMPAPQGVTRWPRGRANRVALTEEARLPVPDAMFDRVILAHALENSEQIRPMMREIWRVMAPEGRLLLIVPNRRGLWTRSDRTPFGWGHPYSRGQLRRFLNESLLTPTDWRRSLYLPPLRSRLGIQALAGMERAGDAWLGRFAGIIMVEAEKRVYAQTDRLAPAKVRRLKPVLAPVARPMRGGMTHARTPEDEPPSAA